MKQKHSETQPPQDEQESTAKLSLPRNSPRNSKEDTREAIEGEIAHPIIVVSKPISMMEGSFWMMTIILVMVIIFTNNREK